MDGWIAIEQWARCQEMARPGIVFEIRNRDGNRMVSECVVPMPPAPFDWKSGPIEFRAIAEEPPRHSSPIPAPKG